MDFDLSDYIQAQAVAPSDQSPNTNFGPYLNSVGGGYAAMAAIRQGNETSRLMKMNASLAGAQAVSESQAGASQAELYRTRLNQTLGKQRAAIGGSNLTVSGSPLRSLEATAELGAGDLDRIYANSARKTWGFRVQQASDLYRAKEASGGGWQSALGGLITTSARSYGQWAQDY